MKYTDFKFFTERDQSKFIFLRSNTDEIYTADDMWLQSCREHEVLRQSDNVIMHIVFDDFNKGKVLVQSHIDKDGWALFMIDEFNNEETFMDITENGFKDKTKYKLIK